MNEQQLNQLASNLEEHDVFKFKTKGWKRQKAFSIDCKRLEKEPNLLGNIVSVAINGGNRPMRLTVEQYMLERYDDGVEESKVSPDDQDQDQSDPATVGIAAGSGGGGRTHVGVIMASRAHGSNRESSLHK